MSSASSRGTGSSPAAPDPIAGVPPAHATTALPPTFTGGRFFTAVGVALLGTVLLYYAATRHLIGLFPAIVAFVLITWVFYLVLREQLAPLICQNKTNPWGAFVCPCRPNSFSDIGKPGRCFECPQASDPRNVTGQNLQRLPLTAVTAPDACGLYIGAAVNDACSQLTGQGSVLHDAAFSLVTQKCWACPSDYYGLLGGVDPDLALACMDPGFMSEISTSFTIEKGLKITWPSPFVAATSCTIALPVLDGAGVPSVPFWDPFGQRTPTPSTAVPANSCVAYQPASGDPSGTVRDASSRPVPAWPGTRRSRSGTQPRLGPPLTWRP